MFGEHVWINPFWEDDVYEVEALMGADRVILVRIGRILKACRPR